MAVVVNIDGELHPPETARVSVFDHGFLYGDSVYETLRTYRGRLFLLTAHLERLRRSAARIGLELPWTTAELCAEVERTVAAADNPETAVRLTVTRGEGPIGTDPRLCRRPCRIILARPLPEIPAELYRDGVPAIVSRTLRNSPHALDPAIKSGNFLNNIQAIREAHGRGAYEALMLDDAGNVVEGTQSNVFLVTSGEVATPGSGLLRGLTRETVIELGRAAGIAVAERDVFVTELFEADELFLTSSLKGVLPVTTVNGRPIGSGKPGAVTRRLGELYAERTLAPPA